MNIRIDLDSAERTTKPEQPAAASGRGRRVHGRGGASPGGGHGAREGVLGRGSPASGRNRDRQGFHRTTNPLHFAIC